MEEKILKRFPKLSDAYLNYMYRYGCSSASGGIMQLDAIIRSLQKLTDRVLGKNQAVVLVDQVSRTKAKK